MEQNKQLHAAIKNNRPALLLGAAGFCKTATVQAIGKELNMPVHVLLLAGILPEDLGGLIRPSEMHGKPCFGYLAPD